MLPLFMDISLIINFVINAIKLIYTSNFVLIFFGFVLVDCLFSFVTKRLM